MNQDFLAYYSTLPNVELLNIKANQQNYQPEAVEAALFVLQSRTVTGEDHQALEEIIVSEKQQELQKKEKKEALNTLTQKIAETYRPGKRKNLRQQLMLFCTGLSILFLYRAFHDIRIAYYAISRGYFFNSYTLLTLFDLIATPLMIFLLFKRKKAGWTIAAVIYTAAFLIAIENVLFQWGSENILFRLRPSVATQVVAVLLNGGILYYLNTRKFTRIFAVNTKWQMTTVISSAIAFFLFLFIY